MKLNKKTESENDERQEVTSKVYYKPGVYTVTLNPCDKYQFLGQAKRFDKFRDMINELFMDYPTLNIDYVMHLELSEPRGKLAHNTGGSRLHIHGHIRLRNNKAVFNFLINKLYQMLKYGWVKMDILNDPQIWETYITKQKLYMPKGKDILTNLDDPKTIYIPNDWKTNNDNKI